MQYFRGLLRNKPRFVWYSLFVLILFVVLNLFLSTENSQSQPITVRVNRWLEVQQVAGPVIYHNASSAQPGRKGQRLQAIGDGIDTGRNARATLSVDTGVGTVQVAEQTSLRVQELRLAPDNGRITRLQVTGGQVRLKVRPFTHSGSKLEILTPAGISGVRGTEFGLSVQPSGKTGLATLQGSVVSSAQGQAVAVNAGFQNLVITGEPPSPPVPLRDDPSLKVEVIKQINNGLHIARFIGQTDPVNQLTINGEPQVTDRYGRFDVQFPVPSRPRYTAVVTTPLGKRQAYQFSLD